MRRWSPGPEDWQQAACADCDWFGIPTFINGEPQDKCPVCGGHITIRVATPDEEEHG